MASDLEALAEQYQRHAIAWDAAPAGLSGEVCARHAEDWDALHTLVLAAGAYVELIANHWAPDTVVRAEEDVVTAARRLAAHLREPAGSPQSARPPEPTPPPELPPAPPRTHTPTTNSQT